MGVVINKMKNIIFARIRHFSTALPVQSNAKEHIQYKLQTFNHPNSTKLREEFWQKENYFEKKVRISELNENEKLIYQLHKHACQKGQLIYTDPKTGRQASTRLKHFLRGRCCGSACRHVVSI